MNILYLCYWSINDGLTHSTIFPHLDIISKLPDIQSVTLCTIERQNLEVKYTGPQNRKIRFSPLYSKNLKPSFLNKIADFILFPKQIIELCKKQNIDKILARGAPTGALAWHVYQKIKLPFIVESFEPHSSYMLESGVWSKYNPKYLFQKKWEEKEKRYAEALITVSENYKNQLIKEGVNPQKVFTIPCCVDLNKFSYDKLLRQDIRQKLGLNANHQLGIYVGKFGDIYYREEAFHILKKAFELFGEEFFVILLSPDKKDTIVEWLNKYALPINRFFIACVPHIEINGYLSAADFAFSFVKPADCRKFCSPIKDGEYWANGLPIMMAENIGDDSDIVLQTQSGVVFNMTENSIQTGLTKLAEIAFLNQREDSKNSVRKVAEKYRNFDAAKSVYQYLFSTKT